MKQTDRTAGHVPCKRCCVTISGTHYSLGNTAERSQNASYDHDDACQCLSAARAVKGPPTRRGPRPFETHVHPWSSWHLCDAACSRKQLKAHLVDGWTSTSTVLPLCASSTLMPPTPTPCQDNSARQPAQHAACAELMCLGWSQGCLVEMAGPQAPAESLTLRLPTRCPRLHCPALPGAGLARGQPDSEPQAFLAWLYRLDASEHHANCPCSRGALGTQPLLNPGGGNSVEIREFQIPLSRQLC